MAAQNRGPVFQTGDKEFERPGSLPDTETEMKGAIKLLKGNGGLWGFPNLSHFTVLSEAIVNLHPTTTTTPPLQTQKDFNSSRKHKYYASLLYFQGLY